MLCKKIIRHDHKHLHHNDLTLGVLKHDPGGGDVVGCADVVVDLRKLLRHVGQLVLKRIVFELMS